MDALWQKTLVDFIISKIGYIIQKHYIDCI